MKRAIAACVFLAAGLVTSAEGASGLGQPRYGGTGCPAGTATAKLNGTTLTVRYSAYRVRAGGNTGKRFDRKACSISIPVRVPAGKSVSIVSAEYRGDGRLPAGAKAKFRAEYFLAGGTGPVASRTLNGPAQGSFTLRTPGKSLVRSSCGADVILRTNSSLNVNTSGRKAASLSIRSQDVRNAVTFKLQWRDC